MRLAERHRHSVPRPDLTVRPFSWYRNPVLVLASALFLLCAGLLIYSQTLAFALDEGFHLLAAQLINSGKTPYLDFCFPQTPLNAYWNAGWMRLFGDSWRLAHALAALLTSGAIILTAEFMFSQFPVPRWRLPSALMAACVVALSIEVVKFGALQAYGMGLFLVIASFRVSIATPDSKGVVQALLAGLVAGADAGCSLLTAPVAPVLLIWIFTYNRAGSRLQKSIAFVLGALVPFIPVFWLFARAPRRVFFNVVQYQLLYRRVNWGQATLHDLDVLTSWLNSSQALIMGLLAIAGFFFTRASNWDQHRKSELYLSAWLAAALTAYLSIAHPTFERYYLFAVPFFAILAPVGVYGLACRLWNPDRPRWPATALIALFCLSLAKGLFDSRDSYTWADYEKIAQKVDQVTPPHASLWADEVIYFLTRRQPPPGLEFSYSHKLELPPDRAALFHIISERELEKRVKAGAFTTVATCADDDKIDELGLPRLYAKKADVSDCEVFWGLHKRTNGRITSEVPAR